MRTGMQLVSCEGCGSPLAKAALHCPGCGAPGPSTAGKKVLAALVLLWGALWVAFALFLGAIFILLVKSCT